MFPPPSPCIPTIPLPATGRVSPGWSGDPQWTVPPFAMSVDAPAVLPVHPTGSPGHCGGSWVASASSQSSASDAAQRAFDESMQVDSSFWHSTWSSAYGATTGAYVGARTTTVAGQPVPGEWIQLQLPRAYRVTSFTIVPRISTLNWSINRSPSWLVLAGGNSSSGPWELLLEYEQQTSEPSVWKRYNAAVTGSTALYNHYKATFTVQNPGAYTHYRLIGRRMGDVEAATAAQRDGCVWGRGISDFACNSWQIQDLALVV